MPKQDNSAPVRIDDAKLDDLAAKAAKATPGERSWATIDHGAFGETEFLGLRAEYNVVLGMLRGQIAISPDDAEFIAYVSPETIAALVAEVKRWRAVRDEALRLPIDWNLVKRDGRIFPETTFVAREVLAIIEAATGEAQ